MDFANQNSIFILYKLQWYCFAFFIFSVSQQYVCIHPIMTDTMVEFILLVSLIVMKSNQEPQSMEESLYFMCFVLISGVWKNN